MTVDAHHFAAFVRLRLNDRILSDVPDDQLDAVVADYLTHIEAQS
jgi:hypothetical protein